jgi:hypothetical protein
MLGMFKFLGRNRSRPKYDYSELLSQRDDVFLEGVKSVIQGASPNAHANIVFAYKSMTLFLQVFRRKTGENPNAEASEDVDGFIMLAEKMIAESQEDKAQRRGHWFAQAGLVRRATDIALKMGCIEDAGMIWVKIAKSGWLLKDVYDNNILWDKVEKQSFDMVTAKKTGALSGGWFIVNFVVPKDVRSSKAIREFARTHGIFPSST